ncbi:MAG: EAL domain-containing protein, partial [Sulfuricellaceae bacterium]|nr:EAL domain-containing protein [Sulfuricellaceae bacterium]
DATGLSSLLCSSSKPIHAIFMPPKFTASRQICGNSSASLPLHRNGEVVGAFSLYSSEIGAFDEAARNLLLEMVTDIDYALSSFEQEARRKQAEDAWSKLSQVVEQSPNAILITDLAGKIEYVNLAFVQTTGYTLAEVMGKNPSLLQSGKTPHTRYQDMWAHLNRGESWQGELINKRKDHTEYVEWTKISPVRQEGGSITHYVGIKEDITERKRTEERIQYLANFDTLTGLPNRAQLEDRAKYAIGLAQRSQGSLTVMFLDLDNFKDINDTLGHTVGDSLLIELSQRLGKTLREEDTVARLGGDEFILLLPGADAPGAAQVAQKLLDVIAEPYQIEQHDLNLTASIGIALYPDDGHDLETLSKNADTAMYRVKQDGRRGYRFFTAEMQARSARTLQLGNALRHALERGELQVHYQPQLSMKDGRIVGAEALLRWRHPELGAVSPMEFIPVAEDSGLILPIGEWVLKQAVQQAKSWRDGGLAALVMAVNLSAVQFRHHDLPDLIARILDEAGLPPEYLELELTEGVAMHDPQTAIAVMDKLHERGIRMSIDDFGTGYSSLSYLKKFKVYKLKIDQSFVRDIGTDPEDKAIVSAIIHMATSLGLKTIAEGVETEGQLAFLREQGCDEVQGYYFSKPLPADLFAEFVRASLR